jgi:hypothetical protein
MFNWLFRPKCPCDSAAKSWIEERLHWLAAEFADSAISGRGIVLPTPEFFPDRYDGSEQALRTMLDRVCGYMDVAPNLIELEFFENVDRVWLVNDAGQYLPSGHAGTYSEGEERFIVRLDQAALDRPMELVGTMAHELAHVRLLGENRITPESFDHELLTDLAVVHFGLGVFLANSPRAWTSTMGKWPGTELRMPEYMSGPMYGWALAHLAWFRGETKPTWSNHLSMAARVNLKQGISYLLATGDSTYRPSPRRD